MARERSSMGRPLLGSVLLHGGLAAALLISWPWLNEPVHMEASVPVTLVAQGPTANVRPAEQAPEEAPAMTEEPAPEATPEPPAPPTPEPAPAPKSPPKPAPKQPKPEPAAKPVPKPAPKKAEPTPTPKKPAPARPAPAKPSLDLDALADSLKQGRPKPKSSAAKGRAQLEKAIQARAAIGQADALAASALKSLSADLARRWNPNCEVEGGRDVMIEATFKLNAAGRLVGAVQASGENSSNPVVKAASDRAKEAVHAAQPFENLPEALYGERITVRFNASNACATG